MASTVELAELHQLIGGLRRCVASLRSRYGDIPAMRRIVNDAERIQNDLDRLDIDAAELDMTRPAVSRPAAGEKIIVSDTEYSREFWRDVDDEGLGGQSGLR